VSKGGEQGRQARLVEELVDLAPPCDQLGFGVAEDLLDIASKELSRVTVSTGPTAPTMNRRAMEAR
jgi:hypothetical protein